MENNSQSGNESSSEPEAIEYTPEQKQQSRSLLRARTRLMVCLWTLPVYVIAVWMLLSNQRDIEFIMYFYMAVWAAFAVDMARRSCPKCHKQFFVEVILMSLRARRCVHCGFDAVQAQKQPRENEVTF